MHVESASQSVTIHPSPPAAVRLQAVPGNGQHQLPFPVALSSKGEDCKGLWLLGEKKRRKCTLKEPLVSFLLVSFPERLCEISSR